MMPSQAAVPLHLALTWLAIKVLPPAHEANDQVYSSTFVGTILELISAQILEARSLTTLGFRPSAYPE